MPNPTSLTVEQRLKECPFCGSDQTFLAPNRSLGDTVWEAGCKACYAITSRDLESHAIAAWNTRHLTSTDRLRDALELRPEVLAFARLMERQLRANDHKPGWKNDDPAALARRICQEYEELQRAMRFGLGSDQIGKEAADVANFAMMIADVCGALTSTPAPSGEREALEKAETWLRAISTWLLETDNDMKLPNGILDTDPEVIADRLAALQGHAS